MILLGLTGSIGMGKSTVAAMFRSAGVPVFDVDAAVHRLQGPEGRLLAAIERAFPGSTGPQGVDRAVLGRAVFGDTTALRRLEAIVHPAVRAERDAFIRRRVLARPAMSQAKFAQILARQVPDAEKRRRGDFIVPTGTTRAETRRKVTILLACLRARGIRYCRYA